MNRYTKVQKDKITQFRGITGASEKIALDCLKQSNWGVEAAIDFFFTSGISTQVASVDPRAIESLFQKYKDADGDSITAEGVMQFCSDLEVDPADPVVLVIAFYMNTSLMGRFTKEEFTNGLLKLNCDSVDKLKKRLPDLKAELNNEERFRDIYLYAYLFSREEGQKCVHFETAVGMWSLLLGSVKPWVLLESWLQFLREKHNRAISRDTWNQLYDFIKTVKPDFSNYDENSAWPYLLDDFVDWMKSKSG